MSKRHYSDKIRCRKAVESTLPSVCMRALRAAHPGVSSTNLLTCLGPATAFCPLVMDFRKIEVLMGAPSLTVFRVDRHDIVA